MAVREGVAPQFVSVGQDSLQIIQPIQGAGRPVGTKEPQSRIVRSGESVAAQNGAASQESGTREIIESERDQGPLGADRKRFSEHQSRRFSLVIIVKSCPRILRRHMVLLASYDCDFLEA